MRDSQLILIRALYTVIRAAGCMSARCTVD